MRHLVPKWDVTRAESSLKDDILTAIAYCIMGRHLSRIEEWLDAMEGEIPLLMPRPDAYWTRRNLSCCAD